MSLFGNRIRKKIKERKMMRKWRINIMIAANFITYDSTRMNNKLRIESLTSYN